MNLKRVFLLSDNKVKNTILHQSCFLPFGRKWKIENVFSFIQMMIKVLENIDKSALDVRKKQNKENLCLFKFVGSLFCLSTFISNALTFVLLKVAVEANLILHEASQW